MEVDGTLLTILGITAGVLILTGWVEQIYKGYKTKRLKDISKFLMIFIAAGSILWLIYGIIVSDVFIIGTNTAGIILMVIVFTMKKRYDKLSKAKQP
ncbi:MAG: SemiSWEET family transporter [Nitrosopumilus sp.]|jgi:MtN3 and saliva related transmembrane protein|nr:SemiSWEET family transporter [Nitrosopumilus sp.]MDF2423551.1 SemiSWEET family transporter [Nitrosopumilus sp.]MDF2424590.1 SemiSWEET family transporter [Nitrosopumilus sp.]MDF2425046.1 SemiSWEET family transporter [Nitrosopumilus sp.]MDF2427488.1 SemiSWEET family transporter [Nitrosopumilus sp.]